MKTKVKNMDRFNMFIPVDIKSKAMTEAKKQNISLAQYILEGLELRLEVPTYKERLETQMKTIQKNLNELKTRIEQNELRLTLLKRE